MGFSPKIKKEVRKKADFRCCRCHAIGIDVHHIKPTKDQGTDDISNAAPLCQNCHNQFGDNPIKRAEITEMRDAWYEKVDKMFSIQSIDQEAHRRIDETVNKIERGAERGVKKGVEKLKDELIPYLENMVNNLTPANAQYIASGIVNISTGRSSVQAWYTPGGPIMTKKVVNGTEEF